MEGNGPIEGSKVKLGIAMCGEDCIALDSLAAKIVGFNFVPYLSLCGKKGIGVTDLDKIRVLREGFEDLMEISKKFKPHYLYRYQIMTKDLNAKMPNIDFRLLISFMKRYYRVKDKVLERMRK